MMQTLKIFCALLAFNSALAQTTTQPSVPSTETTTEPGIFDFEIRSSRQRSSTYWYPLSSLFVPGLGQFMNRQTGAGLTYSIAGGTGLGLGLGIAASRADEKNADRNDVGIEDSKKLTDQDKLMIWGLQTYQTAGSLSTYHAFRSVVQQRQKMGDFQFLTENETNADLMVAPFKLKYFARPTTFIPLGILLGGLIYFKNKDNTPSRSLTLSDGAFTGAISYNAGVGEEALFRGYMMMNLRESWGSDFWSNSATATVFSAAHYSDYNRFPWPQLVMGFYFGWLTQSNNWTLSEAIFLHTWWDIIAISAAFAEGVTTQTLWLPVLAVSF